MRLNKQSSNVCARNGCQEKADVSCAAKVMENNRLDLKNAHKSAIIPQSLLKLSIL